MKKIIFLIIILIAFAGCDNKKKDRIGDLTGPTFKPEPETPISNIPIECQNVNNGFCISDKKGFIFARIEACEVKNGFNVCLVNGIETFVVPLCGSKSFNINIPLTCTINKRTFTFRQSNCATSSVRNSLICPID